MKFLVAWMAVVPLLQSTTTTTVIADSLLSHTAASTSPHHGGGGEQTTTTHLRRYLQKGGYPNDYSKGKVSVCANLKKSIQKLSESSLMVRRLIWIGQRKGQRRRRFLLQGQKEVQGTVKTDVVLCPGILLIQSISPLSFIVLSGGPTHLFQGQRKGTFSIH